MISYLLGGTAFGLALIKAFREDQVHSELGQAYLPVLPEVEPFIGFVPIESLSVSENILPSIPSIPFEPRPTVPAPSAPRPGTVPAQPGSSYAPAVATPPSMPVKPYPGRGSKPWQFQRPDDYYNPDLPAPSYYAPQPTPLTQPAPSRQTIPTTPMPSQSAPLSTQMPGGGMTVQPGASYYPAVATGQPAKPPAAPPISTAGGWPPGSSWPDPRPPVATGGGRCTPDETAAGMVWSDEYRQCMSPAPKIPPGFSFPTEGGQAGGGVVAPAAGTSSVNAVMEGRLRLGARNVRRTLGSFKGMGKSIFE